jgi:tetratricopeptide (TPR) repeat protein
VLAALAATASAHHAVSTTNAQAQAAFDRGLTLLYAYNGPWAGEQFSEALKIDPHLAMAAWGQAMAAGPDLNTPLDRDHFQSARRAAQRAESLAAYASPQDRAYIDAVAARYAGSYSDRDAQETHYRDAMAQLVARYPFDDDAATLDAEALIEHVGTPGVWSADGREATPTGQQILSLIQNVLARDPTHLYANHLCMHAYDFAHDRAAALTCADRVASWTFTPGEEHVAHMPAHTYIEVGQYAKAVRVSEYAWMLRQEATQPLRYGAHDAYTGWSAAMMLGDPYVAQTWAVRTGQQYNGSDLWATWARFGQWQRIATSSSQSEFYAPLTRGWTDLHYGVLNDARKMLALYSNADTDYRWLLEAAIDERQNNIPQAIDAFQHAILYQQHEDEAETLPLFPANELLGAFYLRQKRYTDARDTFEATLTRYPNDPRALYGLALAQRALGQNERSAIALKSFSGIWNAPTPPALDAL